MRTQKLVIGITGSFGSGKTTVARMFKSSGAAVIDADKIAHGLLKPGQEVYRKLVAVFGKGILKKDKTIDHRRLAGIVFKNRRDLGGLNHITHPSIIRSIKFLVRSSKRPVIILDAPLLFEAGLADSVDTIIVVKTSRANQVRRIQRREVLSKREITQRIRHQIPLSRKVRLANFIIDNDGTIRETRKQVEQIRRLLCKK